MLKLTLWLHLQIWLSTLNAQWWVNKNSTFRHLSLCLLPPSCLPSQEPPPVILYKTTSLINTHSVMYILCSQTAYSLLCWPDTNSIQSTVLTRYKQHTVYCADQIQTAYSLLCWPHTNSIQSTVLTRYKQHAIYCADQIQTAYSLLCWPDTNCIQSTLLTRYNRHTSLLPLYLKPLW